MISIFNLTLAADESREVAITGEYFELRNALYPVALIELLDRSGGVVSRLENPEQSDFVRPGRYETVRVTNGATPQTIKHFYGSGDAGSRRTSGQVQVLGTVGVTGTVSVNNTNKESSISGLVFSAYGACAALAANYSYIQLWNPAGSGKRLVVEDLKIVNTNAAAVTANGAFNVVALTTPVVNGSGKNVNSSAVNGVGALRFQQDPADLIDPVEASMFYDSVIAGGSSINKFTRPYIINPGYGFVFRPSAVNLALGIMPTWIEEAI